MRLKNYNWFVGDAVRVGYRCDGDRINSSDQSSHVCSSGAVVRFSWSEQWMH
ncbi:hypothetical protein [Methylicorpusculum sp.]|uniref:hypothetical protein n=1 Tax=Methylicorpusculum sp. TaxID=2713644 RepID=UPI002ABA4726|nr:hypothetical protein [Methylicorpusculum sp.]MDZ4151166.1 hypothetical protein [Methylicorpusculum sp.]